MSFLDRRAEGSGGAGEDPTPPSELLSDYPALCEYMYAGRYGSGEVRVRSTVTLMAGDLSGLKMVLNDRDQGRSLWATGDELDVVLQAMELLLRSSSPPWRLDAKGAAKKK